MRRISLQTYFAFAEKLERIRPTLQSESANKGLLYFRLIDVRDSFSGFIDDDKAFYVSKHAAKDAVDSINNFITHFINDEKGDISFSTFDQDLPNWQYSGIYSKIESFKSVFVAECRDASIYQLEQILIYKTSDLAEEASKRLPQEIRDIIPTGIVNEFDQAGKAMAFDLPTACGFHVLRALEIMMDHYLSCFSYSGKKCVSWFDYIEAMNKLNSDESRRERPSSKVISMLDRMRQLDRNPLMHPQDTLDITQAETLFSLAAITIIEMARDISQLEPVLSQGNLPLIPSPAAPQEQGEPEHEEGAALDEKSKRERPKARSLTSLHLKPASHP